MPERRSTRNSTWNGEAPFVIQTFLRIGEGSVSERIFAGPRAHPKNRGRKAAKNETWRSHASCGFNVSTLCLLLHLRSNWSDLGHAAVDEEYRSMERNCSARIPCEETLLYFMGSLLHHDYNKAVLSLGQRNREIVKRNLGSLQPLRIDTAGKLKKIRIETD
jgi:hypothetical protein